MINGNTRLYQLKVPMLIRIEMMFTMIATHQAHDRILHSPTATASVTIPMSSKRAPRLATNAPSGPAPTEPAIAPRAIRPRPPRISAIPARNDKIAIIVTPIGRRCGGAYAGGGALGGGIVPAGGPDIGNLNPALKYHYISILDKNRRH